MEMEMLHSCPDDWNFSVGSSGIQRTPNCKQSSTPIFASYHEIQMLVHGARTRHISIPYNFVTNFRRD